MNHPLVIRCSLLAAMLVALVGTHATAAELVLRKRAVLSSPVVRLGDIADIGTATTSELDNLTTTLLLPSPAPGTRQYLRRSQIRDLLASRGVDTSRLYFSGADFVEIGSAKTTRSEHAKAAFTNLSRAELESSVIDAIEEHLHQQAMQSKWEIELKIDEASFQQITRLGTKLVATGGRKPWNGRQQFRLQNAEGKHREFVRVKAQVVRSQPVVVALRAIPKGGLIRTSDVEIRLQSGNIPAQAATELADVVGRESRRSISANAVLLDHQVRAPLQVKRGDSVALYARTAGITIRTVGIAMEDGSLGQLIRVETLDEQNQLSAKVTGRGEATVFATGASAADFATLNHPVSTPRSTETRR